MVAYPGHNRVAALRARLDRIHRQADQAVDEAGDLRRQVDALRAEIKRLSIDVGDQLTRQAALVEELQRRVKDLEQQAAPASRSGDRSDQ
jgi:chromosome segregation ATPase